MNWLTAICLYCAFLPERDYVKFETLLSQICLSSVCLSVTLVHPTQGVEAFFTAVYAGHPLTSVQNFMEIVPGEPLCQGH